MTDWTEVGNATYTYTAFYNSTNKHEVSVRQQKNDPNHWQYKVEKWFPYKSKGMATLVIDVADITNTDSEGKTLVTVPYTQTTRETDEGTIYVADLFTYLIIRDGYEVNNRFEGYKKYNTFNPETGTFSIYMAYVCLGGSSWGSTETLQLPTDAIRNVQADNADNETPVKYYNLQGIRVAKPEKGIFIRKQGNKASKVIRN